MTSSWLRRARGWLQRMALRLWSWLRSAADGEQKQPVWHIGPVILFFVLLGAIAVSAAFVVVGVLVEVSDRPITPAQRFTASFAAATALGAIVALVVSVRRQGLAERSESREIVLAFTERFRDAATQLGAPTPPERLAGVYAMAALADEFPQRAQQCVDVLCGYLRLPFDPAADRFSERSTTLTYAFQNRTATVHEAAVARPLDLEVRATIVRVLAAHLRQQAAHPWSHLRIDLTGAHLVDADFRGAEFKGPVSFGNAMFSGENTWFDGAIFSGRRISFGGATFSGRRTWFEGAVFSGERTSFDRARFSGESTSFEGTTFRRVAVKFDGVNRENDAAITGLSDPTLLDGATITKDGGVFRGWPRETAGGGTTAS